MPKNRKIQKKSKKIEKKSFFDLQISGNGV